MRSLFRVYNKNYWVSIFGPILTFFAPFLITILIAGVYTFQMDWQQVTLSVVIIPALVLLCPYILIVLILPQAIFEIKMSVLVKQLKSSSIKTSQILFVGIVFYAATAIVAFIIAMCSARLIGYITPSTSSQISYMFKQINWWELLYVLIINLLVGCSIGMLLGSVFTSTAVISLIGVMLIFLSCVLAGFLAPLILAPSQHKGIWYISYADILRYPVTSIYEAWFSKAGPYNTNASSLFDFSTNYNCMVADFVPYPFTVFKPADKILNLLMPYATIGVCTILSMRFFKM